MSSASADSAAREVRLPSTTHTILNVPTTYTKLNVHLCFCCDFFFHRIQKIEYPAWYDRAVQRGRRPPIDEKLRSTHGDGVYAHWAGLSDLSRAVKEGCHICRLFLSQLTKTECDRLASLEKKQPLRFALMLSPCTRVSGRYLLRLNCSAFPESQIDRLNSSASLFHDLLIMSTEDDVCVPEKWLTRDRQSSALKTASYWLNDCVDNHTHCANPLLRSSNWPSRLIAVGNNDSEVRLVENSVHKPKYLTLSHCWGRTKMPLTLTLSNKTSLCQIIPVDKLSPTFRDAVAFTRLFKSTGVDFLWIDALCIIQNSEDDWEREAAIMGEIYGNGLCNLAAATGSDGTTGLFPANDTWFSHTCVIKAGPESCLDGSFSIRNKEILCDNASAHIRDKLITSRGWCVQERVLSKRNLYFAKHQVSWDCRTSFAREQDPKCLVDEDYTFPKSKRDTNFYTTEYAETCRKRGVEPNIIELYRQWMGVVQTYTRCNLTRHTDKLVAISGLARKFHESLGPNEEYVAGLWKHYLYLHLLWDGSGDNRTNFRWREYRAPSWSWASHEGPVYNHRTNSEAISSCTSLVRATTEVKPVKADPYSAVSSAILHIEGPLLKLCLGSRTPRQYSMRDFRTESGMHFSLSQGFLISLDFKFPGNNTLDVHCLLMIQETHPQETLTEVSSLVRQEQLAGLILVRQETIQGQYIRIGLGSTLPIELLREARVQRLADKNDYESILENGDYRISII